MKLHFVWIGKTRDPHCAALVKEYLKRLSRFVSWTISELKEATGVTGDSRIIEAESAKILAAVERDAYVILLDEKGQHFSSVELADLVNARQLSGIKCLTFIIGGFAGVSDEVKKKAHLQLALSRLTLTHELARVLLTEQAYRAYTLLAGFPYHKF